MSSKQSDSFKQNRFFWTVFGLWPGNIPDRYYKYFSFTYLIITFVAYNALLTLNLYKTPRRIDLLIREVIFSFTEITVASKVSTILFKRKKLVAIFEMLDRDEFKGNDYSGREIVRKHNYYYKTYLMMYTYLSNFTYFSQVLFPVVGFLIFKTTLDLPICKYYFLSDETRQEYFTLIFLYQAFGMYGHMMYNVNIDTLIAGYMVLAIGQVKVLCHDLENLKVEKSDTGNQETLDLMQQQKLRKIVNHYSLLLEYCNEFQNVISGTMFVQYGIGAGIICVIMCGLLLPSTVETFMFMVGYFIAMNLQIFVPAWLGTQLNYESQELMVAAYKSEWLPRSESFKRSVKLFVERAKQPVIITGLTIFPLSLATYISKPLSKLVDHFLGRLYKSEWLPRSERYKRNVKLFVEQAKHPVIITGLTIFPLSLSTYIWYLRILWWPRTRINGGLTIFPLSLATYIWYLRVLWWPRTRINGGFTIFPLSLATYISIMKTAYSCFALLRIIQDRQYQEIH